MSGPVQLLELSRWGTHVNKAVLQIAASLSLFKQSVGVTSVHGQQVTAVAKTSHLHLAVLETRRVQLVK